MALDRFLDLFAHLIYLLIGFYIFFENAGGSDLL